MSHIPNTAMPHAMAEPGDETHSQFDFEEWKAWGSDQLAWGREQLGPLVDKVRNDPKLLAVIVGTLAVAALPLLRSRRRRHHAFA